MLRNGTLINKLSVTVFVLFGAGFFATNVAIQSAFAMDNIKEETKKIRVQLKELWIDNKLFDKDIFHSDSLSLSFYNQNPSSWVHISRLNDPVEFESPENICVFFSLTYKIDFFPILRENI